MRGNIALAAVTAFFPIGCGSNGLLASDAGPVHDATAHDVAPVDAGIGTDAGPLDSNPEQPDEGPSVTCEGGAYFIRVNYDGGSMVLGQGSGGAGVPTLGNGPVCTCAEDCPFTSSIWGASDAGSLNLLFTLQALPDSYDLYACFGRSLGTWSVGPGTLVITSGQLHLPTFPAVGGTASGDYAATLIGDAGTISGTFCVLRTQ